MKEESYDIQGMLTKQLNRALFSFVVIGQCHEGIRRESGCHCTGFADHGAKRDHDEQGMQP